MRPLYQYTVIIYKRSYTQIENIIFISAQRISICDWQLAANSLPIRVEYRIA